MALLFCSCHEKTDEFTQQCIQCFRETGATFNKETEVCLIIPGGGCPGCIASGMAFVVQNQEEFSRKQNKYEVVFTRVGSKKLLKRTLGDLSIDDLNCRIDLQDQYLLDTHSNEYPLVLYLNQGKIQKAESQTPTSDALNHLYNVLYQQ